MLAGKGTIDTRAFGLTYAGTISGTGALTKTGSGTLALTAANTFSGGTVLAAGAITANNNAALGTGPVTFGGGTLQAGVDGLALNNAAVLATSGTIDTQAFGFTYVGTISGGGPLTKVGTGTLALTAANTYSGGTALNAGTLLVSNSAALGTGAMTFNGGGLQAGADGLMLANAAVLARNGTIDTQGFGLGYAGSISGPGMLTKVGGGTLGLLAANSYSGGTALDAGTIAVGNNAALGTGPVTFKGGALQAAADGLTLGNAAVLAGSAVIDTRGFGLTYGGVISGPAA